MIEEIRAKIGKPNTVYDLRMLDVAPTPFMALDIETYGHDKRPGDTSTSNLHGIAGIAIGNMHGDAAYIVVNDGKDYSGVPITQAIDAVNALLAQAKVVCLHYCKFDLGFLIRRGLDISKVRIVDTWMLHSIRSQGNYKSNALKDIIRDELKIETSTEAEKDQWMEANHTEDYGDVPTDIMGKYAVDDVRYVLLVLFSLYSAANEPTEAEWNNHDLYVQNILHLIRAEGYGIAVNVALCREYIDKCTKLMVDDRKQLFCALGSATVDVEDEQVMLAFMHQRGLHPGPRQAFGTLKYVYDNYFLRSVKNNDLVEEYTKFHTRQVFVKGFSVKSGQMRYRQWVNGNEAGFHPSFMPNVFSKGGSPVCKAPDITDTVYLYNEVRKLFVPRKGHTFTMVRAANLPAQLLGYYASNTDLQAACHSTATLFDYIQRVCKVDFSEDVISLMFLKIFNGFGFRVLEQFFKIIGEKADKKSMMNMCDKFQASVPGLVALKTRLEKALHNECGFCRDRNGRVLKIEENDRYKALGTLIKSSNGSIISVYLNLFCRLAQATQAHLVMAHGAELVFEVPDSDRSFNEGIRLLIEKTVIDPVPYWMVRTEGSCWQADDLDVQSIALERL